MDKASLLKRASELASQAKQRETLSNGIFEKGELPRFQDQLMKVEDLPFKPKDFEILQVNMGYMCNQVCAHCHVDAGPDRKEIMTQETMEYILKVIEENKIKTIDLTGGAPELNPGFRWFIHEIRKVSNADLIVRCNLTIILANKRFFDLPQFFAEHRIHVVSSLPFYKRNKTDRQRGDGVFDKSIRALQMLNKEGYGTKNENLKLDLVYNPAGAFLPAPQSDLEGEFKKALKEDFGINFNNLLAITNLPVSRFLDYLIQSENYEDYMRTLVDAYNPTTLESVMCRNTVSVGWDGRLFDCDFNQMLGMELDSEVKHIRDFEIDKLQERNICVSQHCYGCTAGAGSSCGGEVV